MKRICTLLAVALALVGPTACGDDGGAGGGSVPDGAVAVVGSTTISRSELREQVAALASTLPGGAAASDKTARAQVERQALSTLLLAKALEQEARNRGIEVKPAEVRQRWHDAVAAQFRTRKALRRFLGGQSERDALAQLRQQLLTERIDSQVAENAGGGKQGARAVREFHKEFDRRWRQKTTCRDRRAASLCATDED